MKCLFTGQYLYIHHVSPPSILDESPLLFTTGVVHVSLQVSGWGGGGAQVNACQKPGSHGEDPGVDLTNQCSDVCVKDSETEPFCYPYGWDHMGNIPHIEGLHPDISEIRRKLKGYVCILLYGL